MAEPEAIENEFDDDVDAIYFAIKNKNKALVDEIIEVVPGVLNRVVPHWDGTPLMYTITSADKTREDPEGDPDFIDLALHIIECGGDLTVATQDMTTNYWIGFTALQAACACTGPGLEEFVEALLAKGVDPAQDAIGLFQVLKLVLHNDHEDAAKVLQKLVALPAVKAALPTLIGGDDHGDYGGRSILVPAVDLFVYKHDRDVMLKILLDAGVDPTYPGSGLTVLDELEFCAQNSDAKYKKHEHVADAMKHMVRASIDASLRARWFFRLWLVADAADAIPAAIQHAQEKGLAADVQQQKVVEAAPACLAGRVRSGSDLPTVCRTSEKDFLYQFMEPEPLDVAEVLQFALSLPHDVFMTLMGMMVPPGDLAWQGEELGALLGRL